MQPAIARGRYDVLHAIGWEALDELERKFNVSKVTTTEPDQHGEDAATVVRLVPADPSSSPLEVVFDAFPGATLRMGRDGEAHLPVCGCDACDETVEECAQRLREHIEAVIRTRPTDAVIYPPQLTEHGLTPHGDDGCAGPPLVVPGPG